MTRSERRRRDAVRFAKVRRMMIEAWRVRHSYWPWSESEIALQARRWHPCSCGICAGHKWFGQRPFADLRRAPIEERL